MGIGSVLIGMLWGGVALAAYYALYAITPLRLGHGAFAWTFALLADDFQYYWFHRTHHEIRVLWAAHVTHHSSQRYNLATALRQSWIPMTTLPFQAPLALLGVDPLMIVTVHGINLIYQFWIHTETIDRLGPLEAVLQHAVASPRPPRLEPALSRPQLRRDPDRLGPPLRDLRAGAREADLRAHEEHRHLQPARDRVPRVDRGVPRRAATEPASRSPRLPAESARLESRRFDAHRRRDARRAALRRTPPGAAAV